MALTTLIKNEQLFRIEKEVGDFTFSLETFGDTIAGSLSTFSSSISKSIESLGNDNWDDEVKDQVDETKTNISNEITKASKTADYIKAGQGPAETLKSLVKKYVTEYNNYEWEKNKYVVQYRQVTIDDGEESKTVDEETEEYKEHIYKLQAYAKSVRELETECLRIYNGVKEYFESYNFETCEGTIDPTTLTSDFNFDEKFKTYFDELMATTLGQSEETKEEDDNPPLPEGFLDTTYDDENEAIDALVASGWDDEKARAYVESHKDDELSFYPKPPEGFIGATYDSEAEAVEALLANDEWSREEAEAYVKKHLDKDDIGLYPKPPEGFIGGTYDNEAEALEALLAKDEWNKDEAEAYIKKHIDKGDIRLYPDPPEGFIGATYDSEAEAVEALLANNEWNDDEAEAYIKKHLDKGDIRLYPDPPEGFIGATYDSEAEAVEALLANNEWNDDEAKAYVKKHLDKGDIELYPSTPEGFNEVTYDDKDEAIDALIASGWDDKKATAYVESHQGNGVNIYPDPPEGFIGATYDTKDEAVAVLTGKGWNDDEARAYVDKHIEQQDISITPHPQAGPPPTGYEPESTPSASDSGQGGQTGNPVAGDTPSPDPASDETGSQNMECSTPGYIPAGCPRPMTCSAPNDSTPSTSDFGQGDQTGNPVAGDTPSPDPATDETGSQYMGCYPPGYTPAGCQAPGNTGDESPIPQDEDSNDLIPGKSANPSNYSSGGGGGGSGIDPLTLVNLEAQARWRNRF